MDNAIYGKTMETLINRIYIKIVSNKRDYLTWTSDLDAKHEYKVTITLNKATYVRMLII